ncbi:hypothetical protein VWN77_11040, partial [Campylobacter coli]
ISLPLGEKSIFLKNYDKILQAYRLLGEGKIEQANILLSQIKDKRDMINIFKTCKKHFF